MGTSPTVIPAHEHATSTEAQVTQPEHDRPLWGLSLLPSPAVYIVWSSCYVLDCIRLADALYQPADNCYFQCGHTARMPLECAL